MGAVSAQENTDYIISNDVVGDEQVISINDAGDILSEPATYEITDDNYADYFNESDSGKLNDNSPVNSGDILKIGNVSGRTFDINKTVTIKPVSENTTILNSLIILRAGADNSVIDGINISNTELKRLIVLIGVDNVSITNSYIECIPSSTQIQIRGSVWIINSTNTLIYNNYINTYRVGVTSTSATAIMVSGSSNVNISKNRITTYRGTFVDMNGHTDANALNGVAVSGIPSNNCVIENNIMDGTGTGDTKPGIYAFSFYHNVNNLTVRNNNISNIFYGVYAAFSSGNSVRHAYNVTVIENNFENIQAVTIGNYGTVSKNNMSLVKVGTDSTVQNPIGVYICGVNAEVSKNTITSTNNNARGVVIAAAYTPRSGVGLMGGKNATIIDNFISVPNYGINLLVIESTASVYSYNATIKNNTIYSSNVDYAIYSADTSNRNNINNTIINNTLFSKSKFGNDAVRFVLNSNNTIENNVPENSSGLLDDLNITINADNLIYNPDSNIIRVIFNPVSPLASIVINITGENNELYKSYTVSSILKDVFNPLVLQEDLSGFYSGEYTINVTYYLYDSNMSKVEKFNISKNTTKIDISVNESVVVGESVIININITPDISGNLVIKVNGVRYISDVPIAKMYEIIEPAGEYTVEVIYEETDNYKKSSASANFTVTKKDSNLKADAVESGVTVTLSDDATGFILLDVNGNSYYAQVNNGKATVNAANLKPGNYTATLTYTGDDIYDSQSNQISISVAELLNPELKVSTDNNIITVSINKDATGFVFVDVGNDAYYGLINNGVAKITLSNLKPATYEATITYNGDENYRKDSSNTTVTVKENVPAMTVNVANNTVEVTLPSNATGYVFVDVENTHIYSPIKNGEVTIPLSGLDSGKTYSASITYSGDDNYAGTSKTQTITIPKDSELIIPEMTVNITDEVIAVTLPSNATGFVLVDIEGNGFYASLTNGSATIKLQDLTAGNHTAEIVYTGDKHYKQLNKTQTFNVEKALGTIISEDLVKIEKNASRFESKFTDSKGNNLVNKTVKFIINGNTYTRTTDNTGKAGLNINLAAGTYSVIINNTQTGEIKINTITVQSRITDNPDLVKYYKNASRFVVQVLDELGNPVKAGESVRFNVNGMFYNRTTNATGHASIAINLQPGDYIITTEYKNCFASNKIKVNSVLSADDLTKKFAERKAFTAKLVDGSGKALANTSVTFNINGVLYTRTTNSEGVASLNINLQAGEYIITTSYNGANIANKVTVTA